MVPARACTKYAEIYNASSILSIAWNQFHRTSVQAFQNTGMEWNPNNQSLSILFSQLKFTMLGRGESKGFTSRSVIDSKFTKKGTPLSMRSLARLYQVGSGGPI